MKKTVNTIKIIAVTLLFVFGLFMVLCESDNITILLLSKVLAFISLWAGSRLFNRWEKAMPSISEPDTEL